MIDEVLDPGTCRNLIKQADGDRWLTTTAELLRAANGPHALPPRRANDTDRPCRLVGADRERPRFAVLDLPVLALRLYHRLLSQLPTSREGAALTGLKPLLRCIEYRKGEGTRAHTDPPRETLDGQLSQLSVLVFLNDHFTGGSVEFPQLGRTVQARTGRVCVFPHSLTHVDHVVLRGRKFVLETEVFYSADWQPYRAEPL
ncbi:WD-repeat protein [Enhygromyxa salina]|uniref:WD-repeat protein n=1 Tax=Enhygromyxa salina TaxID=215803 RepID=A0A0C1ZPN2_9BACT|nr:WD-repeat protein [Enhygromyxa salina]